MKTAIHSPSAPALYRGAETPQAVLEWGLREFSPRIALACSFGMEDIVILHMMKQIREDIRVFALDTGRLPEETYACADAVRRRLGVAIEWYFPRHDAVEELIRAKGLFSFRESVTNRLECCHIRKVEPLARALAGLQAWITGMRRDQATTRAGIDLVEADKAHGGITKINPLAAWSFETVQEYVKRHNLPYNRLHDQGYPSIGCAPCTRAVADGEDPRAGRWWWERADHKECGLHLDGRA